jgi:hypothetical protein
VRFAVADELLLFAESIRAALGEWEAPREPELGTWQDDRDDDLAARLRAAGWDDLSDPGLRGALVAGGLELGRACAPLSLLDDATLGAPLAVGERARHADGASLVVVPASAGSLARRRPVETLREPTLDGSGTTQIDSVPVEAVPAGEASARWSAWGAATLAYSAGLAGQALSLAVEHARTREQFGAPLGALPAVQGRLARAALAVDGMTLTAWAAAQPESSFSAGALLWAGAACVEVTASAHQVHGAVGFALETGLHRYHRRACSVRAWSDAVCAAFR